MRRKLVLGNWKMNGTLADARTIAADLAARIGDPVAEVGLCPPYLHLATVAEAVAGSPIFVGAQDVFWAAKGAFTGRVSAPMLADAGIRWCLVGHSETRGKFGKLETPESTVGYFAETDETVNLKIKALLAEGIRPILCVGETEHEREAGETDSVIRRQLSAGLVDMDPVTVVVAYEPVWAIGTGKVCDTAEAQRVCAMIRAQVGDTTRVLYGGSVSDKNAAELFAQPDIDGGLVGGASLKSETFAAVIAAAA